MDSITREENAAELASEEQLRQAADAEVASDPSLVPNEWMEYEDWLEWTGKDDSFVGNGSTIPGTYDIYEAVVRVYESDVPDAAPAPFSCSTAP